MKHNKVCYPTQSSFATSEGCGHQPKLTRLPLRQRCAAKPDMSWFRRCFRQYIHRGDGRNKTRPDKFRCNISFNKKRK